MKQELIIFDCDGVLIDSEIISHRVGVDELNRLGFPLTIQKSIELFSGIANNNLAQVIHQEYGRHIGKENLDNFTKKIAESILHELKPISGITKVLDYLELNQIKRCIASNADHHYLMDALALVGLDTYFMTEKIYSVSMGKKGKPSPDLFLHAAEQHQVDIDRCLVIEDSVVGITAAKAAKMRVVGFLGGSHAQNEWYRDRIIGSKPDVVVNDAYELLNLL